MRVTTSLLNVCYHVYRVSIKLSLSIVVIVEHLSITNNTKLRTLVLHDPRYPGVSFLLSHVYSPVLEKFLVHNPHATSRKFKVRDYRTMDQHPVEPKMQHITQVSLILQGDHSHLQIPSLAARL